MPIQNWVKKIQGEAYSFAYKRGGENASKLNDPQALADTKKLKLFPDVVEEFSKEKFGGAKLPQQIFKELQRGYANGFDSVADNYTVTA